MDILHSIILVAHVLAGVGVVGLVLLQHGKGADMGAAFGSGASGSLFGATGSANFLSRATAVLAAIFFLTSLGLSYVSGSRPATSGSVMDAVPATSVPAVPAPTPAVPDSKSKDIPK
ncbi:MAG: preprotein translocase subunit SecG [Sulfuritalea sp.]|nr:preprotein translocase subunit SecG [Sulfuritalea sp.]